MLDPVDLRFSHARAHQKELRVEVAVQFSSAGVTYTVVSDEGKDNMAKDLKD